MRPTRIPPRHIRNRAALLAAAGLLAAAPLSAQEVPAEPALDAPDATATIRDVDGHVLGHAVLMQTPSSGVLIRLMLTDAPPGSHAFHIHSVGACEPDLNAAGGHFNPYDKDHGILVPTGRNAGDLPNVHVPANGALTVDVLAAEVTLEKDGPGSLADADGASLMLHAGADPYTGPPRGAAAPRMACGVIER
jgi:Cu-Zn family superoxide dismutase